MTTFQLYSLLLVYNSFINSLKTVYICRSFISGGKYNTFTVSKVFSKQDIDKNKTPIKENKHNIGKKTNETKRKCKQKIK